MEWSDVVNKRQKRLRASGGGQSQGGTPALLELARHLRAALLPQPRSHGNGSVQAEWLCAPCGSGNWQTRAHCRHCGAKKGAPKSPVKPAGAASAGKGASSAAEADLPSKKDTEQGEQGSRPPAPEERCAAANAQADALEASAATLRAAGLADRAAQLEKEAADFRKKGEGPPPGRRLDLAKAFLGRCEARARKALEAVDAARTMLHDAEVVQKTTEKEVEDATQQLAKLRAEFGPGGDAAMGMDADAVQLQRQQETELAKLREVLRHTEAERDLYAARSAGGAPKLPATNPNDLSLEELEAELKLAQNAFADALKEGREEAGDPARVRLLAELSEQVQVAKRRRM